MADCFSTSFYDSTLPLSLQPFLHEEASKYAA
jgi:hypothetical protein